MAIIIDEKRYIDTFGSTLIANMSITFDIKKLIDIGSNTIVIITFDAKLQLCQLQLTI